MIPSNVAFGAGFVGSSSARNVTLNQQPIISEKSGGKKKFMKKAQQSIERRGTKGICTGKNKGRKGGPCPVGSRQYALAQTFKKTASKGGKAKKK